MNSLSFAVKANIILFDYKQFKTEAKIFSKEIYEKYRKENLIKDYEEKVNKLKQNIELMNTKLESVHNLEKLTEKLEN
jgi:uncharacterized protein YlxW (UPF0749 family)